MMDPSERAIPGVSAHFLMMEAESRYSFAKKHIKKNGRILDVACGTGYGTSILSQKADTIYGIDISFEAIAFARDRYENQNTTFLQADVYDIPFKNDYFDAVVGYEMIEHLENPKLFLQEVSRILDKGGTFIISTPNRLVTSPDGHLMSPYHTQEFDPDELYKLLAKHFKQVEVYGQRGSTKALGAHKDFMKSQTARQSFVDMDFLGFRKFVPRGLKERLWVKMGALFGRETQENLTESDFPILKKDVISAQYLVAICKK